MRQVSRSDVRGSGARIRGSGLGGVLAAVTLALTLGAAASAQAASQETPSSASIGKHGPQGGKYRRCSGKVHLSAGDIASQIKAKHMSCREAKKVIKAPATKRGYRCKTTHRNGLPRITCTKGRKAVKFTYIQY